MSIPSSSSKQPSELYFVSVLHGEKQKQDPVLQRLSDLKYFTQLGCTWLARRLRPLSSPSLGPSPGLPPFLQNRTWRLPQKDPLLPCTSFALSSFI